MNEINKGNVKTYRALFNINRRHVQNPAETFHVNATELIFYRCREYDVVTTSPILDLQYKHFYSTQIKTLITLRMT
jgi:hypothetical protein